MQAGFRTGEGTLRMNSAPLVSVIVPFFNAAAFLDECVLSVVGQTYENWELLLVDDASTDDSASLAREHAARHSGRVRRLEHPGGVNRGVSASRNLGLRNARGEYVAFLDADDVWLPRKLEEQVAILERHRDVCMVYGGMQYWFSWTGRAEDAERDYEQIDMGVDEGLYRPPALVTALLEATARAPLPSDALVRTEVARDVGGFAEDRSFAVYEDRVFFVRVELAGPVYAAEKCWVRYRQHPASSSATIDRTHGRIKARTAYLRWFESHLAERGYRGSPLWRMAREHSFPYRHPVAAAVLERARGWRRRLRRGVRTGEP